MNIETVVVGDLDTNCYIAYDPKTFDAVVIDPGDEASKILEVIKKLGVRPLYVLHTHAHPDHFGASEAIRQSTSPRIAIHEDDARIIESRILSLRGALFEPVKVDEKFKDGDVIRFGGESLKVIHTPGHSMGCACFYSEAQKVLFSGDTLFAGDTGRTDLPGSLPHEMARSLKKLMTLPEDVKVYPGHGTTTSISREKKFLEEAS